MRKTQSLSACALVALLGSPILAQTLPKMDLHQQSRDGNPADIVGPEASGNPDFERVWGLQGRRREAWSIGDRVRQFFE